MNVRKESEFISQVDPYRCMKCGKCSAACPSYDDMDIKPHQFVSYVINGEMKSLLNSSSLFACFSCFACVERCPRDVKPGRLLDGVRQTALRKRGGNHLMSDQIPELIDSDMPQQLIVSALRRYRR